MMKKFTVKKPQQLKEFISQSLGVSKGKAKEILDTKNVLVNGRRVWISKHQLKAGDVVEVPVLDKQSKQPRSFSVKDALLYEDEFLVAVNKPPFYVSESKKGSIEDLARRELGRSIRAVHRLDRETSGVLLLVKKPSYFDKFKKLWENKKVKKFYQAISKNKANFKKKVINYPVDGKIAKSVVHTLKTSSGYTLFGIDLKTGRKHQIRIHLAKEGYPIVGDKIYGIKLIDDPVLKLADRQMLHAKSIEFIHPFLKKPVKIEALLPQDFKILAKKLNLS